jgi:hypothetical protein
LHGYDFTVEHAFNKTIKFSKEFEHFRLMMNERKPCEFAIIINKVDVVFLVAKEINGGTSYIEKIRSKGAAN